MPDSPARNIQSERDALMIRLDERTSNIQESISDLKALIRATNDNFAIEIKGVKADLEIRLKRFDDDFIELKKKVNEDFVKKEAFQPVQKIAYSIIGLFGTGIIGSLFALVGHK